MVTQNYQFCGGQTTSFFINEILLPDSSGYKLRTAQLTVMSTLSVAGEKLNITLKITENLYLQFINQMLA
ncbi:MAG: hypothetical protein ACXVDX_21460, partial [Bacteroidia bacterium]